jgi:hypothetical protein
LDKQQLIMITGPNMESQLFCVKPRWLYSYHKWEVLSYRKRENGNCR